MKLLLVGECSRDLHFFTALRQEEMVWADTLKIRSNSFNYRVFFDLIKSLSGNHYDLIILGTYPKIRHQSLPFSVLSTIWRFIKYPMSFGADVVLKLVGDTPIAVIDLRDEPTIFSPDIALLKKCVVFFKRELFIDPVNSFILALPHLDSKEKVRQLIGDHIDKILPISLGLLPEECYTEYTGMEKKIDLFFSGDIVHQTRKKGLRQVMQLREMGVNVMVPEQRVSREEFLRLAASAYLVWSPEGNGWECKRHYEAAAVGSVPLLNRPAILRHRPLQAHEHALYYDPEGDSLQQVVLHALKDKERLRAMGESARAFVFAHHTHKALAQMIIETVLPDFPANTL